MPWLVGTLHFVTAVLNLWVAVPWQREMYDIWWNMTRIWNVNKSRFTWSVGSNPGVRRGTVLDLEQFEHWNTVKGCERDESQIEINWNISKYLNISKFGSFLARFISALPYTSTDTQTLKPGVRYVVNTRCLSSLALEHHIHRDVCGNIWLLRAFTIFYLGFIFGPWLPDSDRNPETWEQSGASEQCRE